jgi:hypothetical protein
MMKIIKYHVNVQAVIQQPVHVLVEKQVVGCLMDHLQTNVVTLLTKHVIQLMVLVTVEHIELLQNMKVIKKHVSV